MEFKLSKIFIDMFNDIKKFGIVGMFVGLDVINVIKGMGVLYFEVVLNYCEVNCIYYVGKFFG